MVHPSLSKIIGKSYWQLAPRFSSPPELLHDTTWEEAQEDIALATFPNMVPIPFGAVIPDGVTLVKEFIEAFLTISSKHGKWVNLSLIVFSQANQIMTTHHILAQY